MDTPQFMPYAQLRAAMRNHWLFKSEIPLESAVSYPMPTRRYAVPAWICFQAPALRLPGQPARQGVPERWWLLDAQYGGLLSYNLCKVTPFTTETGWEAVDLPRPTWSMAEYEHTAAALNLLMDQCLPLFFAVDAPASDVRTLRQDTQKILQTLIPDVLWRRYQCAAPDFFAWLME